MASKIIFRSSNSTVRTLINRHLRPTVTAAITQTNKTESNPVNIYNWHYILPNTFVQQPVKSGCGFDREFAGLSVLEAAKKSKVDEENIDEEYDEDGDDEMEFTVDEDDDDDDDYGDYESGDDD